MYYFYTLAFVSCTMASYYYLLKNNNSDSDLNDSDSDTGSDSDSNDCSFDISDVIGHITT
jgi:hypothetical protein